MPSISARLRRSPAAAPHGGDSRSPCGMRSSSSAPSVVVHLGERRGGPQADEHRLPLVRRREQLRRADAGRSAGRGVHRRRHDQGLRREQQSADPVLPAAGRHQLRPVQRDHRAADLRHRADQPGRAGDRQGDQGREHGPDPRPGPVDGPAAGEGAVRQRDVRADRDRDQARQPRRAGVQGQGPEPVQGRLPLRHQGIRAGRRHQRRVPEGESPARRSRSSRRARASSARPPA